MNRRAKLKQRKPQAFAQFDESTLMEIKLSKVVADAVENLVKKIDKSTGRKIAELI